MDQFALDQSVSPKDLTLDRLITYAAEHNASDLFLKVGSPPGLKAMGKVQKTPLPTLRAEDTVRLARERMTDDQHERFLRSREMNLSFSVPGIARIRQNIYWERDCVATTCRLIPLTVKSLIEIGASSDAVLKLTEARNGLVLVTGPTGSGKSTTLAGMIDHINDTRAVNIITIEDPIEYVYNDKQAFISQRQVGLDTLSFDEALRQVLRQTPDVILIGEMRDLETVNVALQAAETGHLVFGTLHTSSAAETLDRISNMYPPHEREMLWLRLSLMLRGVVSQKLLPRVDGTGRVVAQEIMVVTPSIAHMLEEGQSGDIYGCIRQDGDEHYWGMQTMNQCLLRLVSEGVASEADALARAGNLAELKQMLRQYALHQLSPISGASLPAGSLFATDAESDNARTGGLFVMPPPAASRPEPLPQAAVPAAPAEDDMFVLRRAS